MKKEYWDVTDEQVIENTGKNSSEWLIVLRQFNAEKKSNDVVAFLQKDYDIPRYWARTLTTLYF